MFARLAAWVDRHAGLVVAAWLVAAVVVTVTAPSLATAGTADQTEFVPASAPSGRADALLRREFPDDPTRDSAVIVLARRSGLTAADHHFIASLSEFLGSPAAAVHVKAVQTAATAPELAPVLRSADGAAEMVIVSLRATIFTESGNRAVRSCVSRWPGLPPPGWTAMSPGWRHWPAIRPTRSWTPSTAPPWPPSCWC